MSKTKKTCLYAMGIALYVALSLCIQFPVFENYYLCLGYIAMAVYCYFFGPFAGMTVGPIIGIHVGAETLAIICLGSCD